MVKVKELKARVKRGVKFMNKQYGRYWLRQVDPEQLALDNGTACIIGQVEGQYTSAEMNLLGIDFEQAKDLGFDLWDDDAGPDWADTGKGQSVWQRLTNEWRAAIAREQKLWAKE